MLVAPGPDVTSDDARLAGRARIAFGGVTGALLVPDQDVLDLVLLEDLVVDRKHRAAGIAKNVLDAVIDERTHDHGSAGHLVRIVALVAHGGLRIACLSGFWFVVSQDHQDRDVRHSGNKKGPRRGPCAPPEFGMTLAIPGGAPGYDDKEDGNNIAHDAVLTSQRLRDTYLRQTLCQGKAACSRDLVSVTGFSRLGEREFDEGAELSPSSCPGLSRLRPKPLRRGEGPGIHARPLTRMRVDGRDKPGHDDMVMTCPVPPPIPLPPLAPATETPAVDAGTR